MASSAGDKHVGAGHVQDWAGVGTQTQLNCDPVTPTMAVTATVTSSPADTQGKTVGCQMHTIRQPPPTNPALTCLPDQPLRGRREGRVQRHHITLLQQRLQLLTAAAAAHPNHSHAQPLCRARQPGANFAHAHHPQLPPKQHMPTHKVKAIDTHLIKAQSRGKTVRRSLPSLQSATVHNSWVPHEHVKSQLPRQPCLPTDPIFLPWFHPTFP